MDSDSRSPAVEAVVSPARPAPSTAVEVPVTDSIPCCPCLVPLPARSFLYI